MDNHHQCSSNKQNKPGLEGILQRSHTRINKFIDNLANVFVVSGVFGTVIGALPNQDFFERKINHYHRDIARVTSGFFAELPIGMYGFASSDTFLEKAFYSVLIADGLVRYAYGMFAENNPEKEKYGFGCVLLELPYCCYNRFKEKYNSKKIVPHNVGC